MSEDEKKYHLLQFDAEHASIAAEAKAHADKVKELKKQLDEEMAEAAKAESKLRHAKHEVRKRIESERKMLTIG
jgi:hypothetical protein